jgi:hypothetical protein
MKTTKTPRPDGCVIVERAGKDVGPGSGPYNICLNEHQARTLFGTGQRKLLGCGAWACAWTKGGRRIVKITRDPEDIAGLQLGQGLRHVVKVDKIFRLKDAARDRRTGAPVTVYAVVAEQLRPVHKQMGRWTVSTLCPVKISLRIDVTRSRAPRKLFEVSDVTRKKLRTACARGEGNVAACTKFGTELLDTFQALYRRGVDWQDIHDENVMQDKRGTWKVVDLGLSDARMQARTAPSVLKGGPLRLL